MIFKIKQEKKGKISIGMPKPDERRKRVKVVIGEWDKELQTVAQKGDVIALSKPHSLKASSKKGSFIIGGPGEYEIQSVFFKGLDSPNSSTIYVVWGGEKRAAIISDLDGLGKELDMELVDKLGDVDLLLFSIDGKNPPTSKSLKSYVSQISPAIVVLINGSKKEMEEIMKKMDVKAYKTEEEVVLETVDFKDDKTEYFILKG